jgi:hypothetical protein
MDIETGVKYLVTVREDFIAPDGRLYNAVFGTYSGPVESAVPDEGFLQFGGAVLQVGEVVAVVRTDVVSLDAPIKSEFDGKELLCLRECHTKIYFSD